LAIGDFPAVDLRSEIQAGKAEGFEALGEISSPNTAEKLKNRRESIMGRSNRSAFGFLEESLIKRVVEEAVGVLEQVGVWVENKEAQALLADHGARVKSGKQRIRISSALVEKALQTAPHGIRLFDRRGQRALELEGDRVHFNPGSAALWMLDFETGQMRRAVTEDVVRFARLTEALEHLAAQSTAVIASDVPEPISDRYRLFLVLQHSTKPVVTGTFSEDGFQAMQRMLVAVRGTPESLAERPLAIFDCCPSPPLKWSHLTCQTLMDCARAHVPAELVSMPLAGATAPATLVGALVQMTAENLSGVVIHQLASPGAPLIFGGSPAIFDMRQGTTPMGAIESLMLDVACAQVGKFLGLPTHAYMGLSDAKQVDSQAGLESAMGILLGALAGINVISGPGMLGLESCQSLEKLVLDHEICGMALRCVRGISVRDDSLAPDLYGDIDRGDFFLTSPTTLKWFREEQYFPSEVIDRQTPQHWQSGGGSDIWVRAHERVEHLLSTVSIEPLPSEIERELQSIMSAEGRRYGMDKLPRLSSL